MLLLAALVLGVVVLFKSLSGAIANMTISDVAKRIAQGIATAEGFYVSGSRPARNHNPGDMTADLIGKAVGKDGIFVVYSNDDDGWENLYKQVQEWLDGTSSHAGPTSTITDIASFYTTTDQSAWATNVANYLGVSLDTPIGEVPDGNVSTA